ncbi:YibE/F family protein [Pseudarthrobacter sp. J75]|uniref:YibE/F family protein n=1 Tax=unclassified Pseudarthrobacter TaxID=2647000 RepID=UPI002E824B4E|nr:MULTISPECIES: YibE/F family protein [unclassified Pseudarthrobacter]MEE2521748.1 YibE/F family protein [Pseudarthrobacter sp. J47]MEE2527825.1 YibE/F family protein [Pseudarthrobacter sp. J75]MEE2569393.1 YibE/F family protein [Pseudarthrobacter sp. J64]
MGAGHSHGHAAAAEPTAQSLEVRRRANLVLAVILIPLALLTLAGMAMLWPSGSKEGMTLASPYSAAPGVTFDTGRVQRVATEPCVAASAAPDGTPMPQGSDCMFAYTQPDIGGSPVKVVINPDVAKSGGVSAGDDIRYLNLSNAQGATEQQGSPAYIFVDFVRTLPIVFLAVLYAVVVIAVARWRGLRALVGLVGAYFVLVSFMLPGLAEGKPPLLLALVGSTVIMIGVLYFAHGFSARTSTALLGTMFGLLITALLAAWATDAANLVGVGSHDATTLINISGNISISGIILCGLIISGLGVLNDVTITQSSAVWELYELAPSTSVRKLFTSAMRIGRDHIASTVYTIAFAYAGAALPVLIIVMLYDRPLGETLTSAELSEEVIRTLVGSIGLVLAIPVTTLIAVLVVKATGARTPVASTAPDASLPAGVNDAGSLAAAAEAGHDVPAAFDAPDEGAPRTRRGRRADRGE